MLVLLTMLVSAKLSKEADDLVRRAARYVEKVLHANIEFRNVDSDYLSSYLLNHYQFIGAQIAQQSYVLAIVPNREDIAASIAKHVSRVEQELEQPVIVLSAYMTSAQRTRLISQGVSFIVPGNQLYLPRLGVVLRERFRSPKKQRDKQLSPVAQLVLFHHLSHYHMTATPSELAAELRYTPMSVGRAFDELSSRNIAVTERKGREKVISYTAPPRELIEFCRTLLRKPFRGRHGVILEDGWPDFLIAGESALSEMSDLASPRLPTFAIAADGWQSKFDDYGFDEVNQIELADALIETWYYDPGILAQNGRVDPLSLYAQFWDHPDERVAAAAAVLLEEFEW